MLGRRFASALIFERGTQVAQEKLTLMLAFGQPLPDISMHCPVWFLYRSLGLLDCKWLLKQPQEKLSSGQLRVAGLNPGV